MTEHADEQRYHAAMCAFQEQNWPEVVRHLEPLLITHPDPKGYHLLGQAYLYQEQQNQALAVFEQTILLYPQAPHGYDGLARVLVPLRQAREVVPACLEQAIWACQQSIQLAPENHHTWTRLAHLLNLHGDFVRASQAARQAIALSGMTDLNQPLYHTHSAHYALVEAIFEQGLYLAPPFPLLLDFSVLQGKGPDKLALPAWHGEPPVESPAAPTLVIAADDVYLQAFARPQILSLWAKEPTWPVHIHGVNPTAKTIEWVQRLQQQNSLCSYSWERVQWANPQQARVYLACVRFMRVAEWLKGRFQPLLLSDADLLYRVSPQVLLPQKPYPDMALVAYPGSSIYDRYGAAWVLFSPSAVEVAGILAHFIRCNLTQRAVWMLDQFALYCTLSHFVQQHPDFRLVLLPPSTVSCDYLNDETIWNGAGDRKHKDNAFNRYRQVWLNKNSVNLLK